MSLTCLGKPWRLAAPRTPNAPPHRCSLTSPKYSAYNGWAKTRAPRANAGCTLWLAMSGSVWLRWAGWLCSALFGNRLWPVSGAHIRSGWVTRCLTCLQAAASRLLLVTEGARAVDRALPHSASQPCLKLHDFRGSQHSASFQAQWDQPDPQREAGRSMAKWATLQGHILPSGGFERLSEGFGLL